MGSEDTASIARSTSTFKISTASVSPSPTDVVKVAKKVLKKQDDSTMKIRALAKTILAELKMGTANLDAVKEWIRQSDKFETSGDGKVISLSKEKKRKRDQNGDNGDTNTERADVDIDVQALETTYKHALAAFKADKTNKDLRRVKSAARKAWDGAVAATQDGVQLTCKDCSQTFMFTEGEREFYTEQMEFDTIPTRCRDCNQSHKFRCHDRSKRDNNNPNGKNMCYAFQRGKCTHGDKCKFSHNPDFGGTPPPEDDALSTAMPPKDAALSTTMSPKDDALSTTILLKDDALLTADSP